MIGCVGKKSIPGRVFGKELRRLQLLGLVESRAPHDFEKEYALTNLGKIEKLTTPYFHTPSTPSVK